MCYGCWLELGAPRLVSPDIYRCAELVGHLYEITSSGGNCHIVTDDWNLEDSNIDFCVACVNGNGSLDVHSGERYNNDPIQLNIEKEILGLMKPMSERERSSVLALHNEYFKEHTHDRN